MSEKELRDRIDKLVDAIREARSTKEVDQLADELEKRIDELKQLERQPVLAGVVAESRA